MIHVSCDIRDLEDLCRDLGDLTRLTCLTPMDCAACSQVEQMVKMQISQQRPKQLSLGRQPRLPRTNFPRLRQRQPAAFTVTPVV